ANLWMRRARRNDTGAPVGAYACSQAPPGAMTRTRRRMDSIEVTKVSTAVLVAGIAYFMAGLIGANIVSPEKPAKPAIEVKGVATETAGGPAADAKLEPT